MQKNRVLAHIFKRHHTVVIKEETEGPKTVFLHQVVDMIFNVGSTGVCLPLGACLKWLIEELQFLAFVLSFFSTDWEQNGKCKSDVKGDCSDCKQNALLILCLCSVCTGVLGSRD